MTSQQPYVHDRCVVLHAPNQWWGSREGDCVDGIDGIYAGDMRVVGGIRLSLSGGDLEWVGTGHSDDDASSLRHEYVVRIVSTDADPLVSFSRHRDITVADAGERYEVRNASTEAVTLGIGVLLEGQATALDVVKRGGREEAAPHAPGVRADGAEVRITGPVTRISWNITVAPGGRATMGWRIPLSPDGTMTAPSGDPLVAPAARGRLGRLLHRSIADLNGLMMTDSRTPDSTFFAAGAPWFFTLFGRDSLLASLLSLPISTSVALGTLRTLAGRQGTRHDPATAEQPGKMLHEVRSHAFELEEGKRLPPVYYGSIDSTPLWILLLKEVLAAGVDPSGLSDLRTPLQAACQWLLDSGDADGDGLLEYIDESGTGLANQGWKDSGDSIRFADGTLATAPIALAEVQGYAHEAALAAIGIAEAIGAEVDARALGAFAARVRDRFQAQFWCSDPLGDYPALALDGSKQPVDGVASNMGYLIGSGLLTREQEESIVARLMDPSMFSGFGVRTLSTTNAGYWPFRYHGGSVWTHDTAQIIWSLLRAGFGREARVLANALLDAAEDFEFRLPELFAGHPREETRRALPYPASCRPQAWAAASGVVVWRALEDSVDEVP